MDQNLKQRLVGAIVVTSLAAIFVPMLFDDPIDETGKIINELKIPDLATKAPKQGILELPSTQEKVLNLPDPIGLNEQNVGRKSSLAIERWFIQVGIFKQKDNAIALKNTIKKQGHHAAVSTLQTASGQRYKVTVGPVLGKKRAEKMKVKLDALNKIDSILSAENE